MIAFNKYYNKFNVLSISLVVISLLFLIFKGLNYGIDFKGGTLIELRSTDNKINVSSLRDNLNQMNLGDVSIKNFGNETDFLIKFENNDNKETIIKIKDNGTGITDANKAMTPYFTTKKTGTGLGLPIVTKIINEHSGNFSIRNKSDKSGAVVTISLPKYA